MEDFGIRVCAPDMRRAWHDELRATVTPDSPFGAHLCAAPSEIVRIYSTSGTTGTPSFIPLTAGDLDNWVTGSARSYAASGIAPGQRIQLCFHQCHFLLYFS